MKAKIKAENKKLFKPNFRTVVMGIPVDVSLSQAENEAEKYVLTAMGHLYENHEQLKKDVLARQSKPQVKVLDMNNVKRGTAFEEGSSPKDKRREEFEAAQKKARSKVYRRNGKKEPVEKATTKKKKASKKK